MKRIFILILFISLICSLCLSGCVSANLDYFSTAVAGRGDSVVYEIPVAGFTGISIRAFCDVLYHPSDTFFVTLEIQENLRDYLNVDVRNGILAVQTERVIRLGGKTPVLTVYAPTLSELEFTGAGAFTTFGSITADSFHMNMSGAGRFNAKLDVEELSVRMSGTGEVALSGRSDRAELQMSGIGTLDALYLQTREAEIKMSGLGTARVACSDMLTVDASGAGAVEYIGDPIENFRRSGMVSIKKVG